ncbi:hypothetical protein EA004_09310 [Vibrio anguillarum]|uniref:Uncharacterized protein n=4 Tax=Vibrio TaxID=662 RepID=A0A544C6B5_VIBCL|nr:MULTISPECIES: hypothetical protein [Vibrio]MBF4245236.1 hypothetical protein [Vibrio anguillarum]ASK54266.1 hypothetical protein CEQ48_03895 [Vibrio tarriae]EGQ7879996.1 hypothetical protein [Vibrio cholerae]EGQ9435155.1 hypothetical protein [Vibrio cholerae]EGR1264267.1 hypothetical protein [Vibrio cholerae]
MEQTEKRNQHRFAKQVDEALLDGRASLFLVEEGFFVLEPSLDNGEMQVWVLFAWSNRKGAFKRHLPTVEQLAKRIKAKRLLLNTAVKALQVSLIDGGFCCIETGDVETWCKEI